MVASASEPKHWLIIPAAGIGSRMQADIPKQYLVVNRKTILQHSVEALTGSIDFGAVLLGLSPSDKYFQSLDQTFQACCQTYAGGAERADTVLAGLDALDGRASDADWVWVHDAARPLVTDQELQSLLARLQDSKSGALLALQATDTIKRAKDEQVLTTLDRATLWRAQTPQVFRFAQLRDALRAGIDAQQVITDESSAMEIAGFSPDLVQGKPSNIKVTLPEDLESVRQALDTPKEITMLPDLRVGSGYDVHAFEEGDYVTLGGVQIPYSKGLKAHSDGDVLLHALCDALLGALALGDIGHHFPDTDEKWKGANSRTLLKGVLALVTTKGYSVANVDATIIAQAPKMAPHILQMRKCISDDLGIGLDRVSVKATTTEALGFTGRKEGIAVQATTLLVKS